MHSPDQPFPFRYDVGPGFFATRSCGRGIRHEVQMASPSLDALVTLDFSRVEAVTAAFIDELVCNLIAAGTRVVIAGANADVGETVRRTLRRRDMRAEMIIDE